MPGYRVSEGKYLEILEPGALVNLPIEVDVYDGASPATMLATIETAQEAALQVQLSELGAGRFAIDRAHPKATADILARGNLVKIKTGGVYRGAFWIEEPEEILTSTQEAAGELVKVAGRGALAYVEQAIVYPPVWPTQPGSYVGASHGANVEAGATTISISKPAGLANGDVMIAAIGFVGGSSKTINPPLGWKEFRRVNYGTTLGVSYFRKQATTSEPASYQWVFSNVTGAVGNIVALRNVSSDQTQYAFAATSQGSGTAITNPSLDVPTVDGVLLTFSTATAGSGMTPPAGLTEATDDAQRTNRVMESAYQVGPALGETGDLVTTNSASAAWIGSQVFLPSTTTLEVAFGGDTPGAIMSTLIDRAQARGGIPDLTYDFDSVVDSQGQPWPDTFELTFHAGTTLLDVFRQLVALGVEGEMTHDLRLSLYVNRSRDRTTDVIFRKGYHLLGSVSNLAHLSGLRTRLLVEGAGGRIIEVGPGALEADPKIGRREGFLSMATSDAATDLSRAGEKSLELSELDDQARAVPVTHGLLTAGLYEPWEDYRPGDYVGLDAAGTGAYTEERIVGITIAQAGPLDYSVTLNLNSIYLEAAIRMRRELDALAGTGARSSGSSSLGLGGGGTGGGGASSGLVSATAGDVAGFLYDKIDALGDLTKALGGVAGNRTVELGLSTPIPGALDDLSDVDLTGAVDTMVLTRAGGIWTAAYPPGGGQSPYYLDNLTLHPTWGDDFTGASLDAKWTRRNLTAGDELYQQGGGSFLRSSLGSGTVDRNYLQSWTNPTNAEIILSWSDYGAENVQFMAGIIIMSAASGGVAFSPYNDSNTYLWNVNTSYQYASTGPSIGGVQRRYGVRTWLRIRKAGTSFYGSISRDGMNWSPETSALVFATATDRIGFGRIYNSSAQVIAVDRFTVVNVS